MRNRLAALGVMTAGLLLCSARATTLTSLHQFTGHDGANPLSALTLSGTNLYGSCFNSGPGLYGAVFRLNLDGTGYTNLHNFNGLDGSNPSGALVVTADAIYGTTQYSDSSGIGAVFKMGLDGSGFTNLHTFSDTNGAVPSGQLVLVSNVLYGTVQDGGAGDSGTVFRIQTDGTGFTNLYSFGSLVSATNADGANPFGGLVYSGNCLYGAASTGGSAGNGTLFRLNLDGTGFTNLHTFSALVFSTNNDGAIPHGTLVVDQGTLYGTAQQGGVAGKGAVFSISTNGTGFTCLHSFTGIPRPGSNNLGSYPFGGLVLSGAKLFGTTEDSLSASSPTTGTLYALNTNGSSFSTFYRFTPVASNGSVGIQTNREGAYPRSALTASNNQLYGAAWSGGSSGVGTIFSIPQSPTPVPLSITRNGPGTILSWPDPVFQLQCSVGSLVGFTNIPLAQSPYTNGFGPAPQFFRLAPP